MCSLRIVPFLLLILNFVSGQDVTEEIFRVIKVCSYCTCSEIPDVDNTQLVMNILCSELDKIEDLADLDKIQWPDNPNDLKISATFEGMGLSTLGKLPANSKVETLRFTNNAIKVYWPEPFSEVPNMKKLSFAENELAVITPDLFIGIESLEDLDLSRNKLAHINPVDFKFLQRVKRLNLQSNLLNKIPVDALRPMASLEDLDLSKNGISDVLLRRVDGEVFTKIKRLNLNGNRIRYISEESFPESNVIELLDLSNNVIEVVDKDSFLSCTSLRELNLGQNNITFPFVLPATLQIAILKLNTLYHWPQFPSNITFIDLSYNRLSTLYDGNYEHFNNVEILNIGGNQIKDFELEYKLPRLFSLDVSYNLLSDVPKSLNSQILPNLEDLRLDGNPIQYIYFTNILALKTLYMNDMSKLSSVGDKAFSNVIGRGDGSSKNCFSLYLSNCAGLRQIKEGAFDGTNLCSFDISRNNLVSISKTSLDWMALDSLNLQHNPWDCSCDLQWLVDDLLPRLYQLDSRLLTELRCGSPRPFEGLRLVHWYNWTERALCSGDYLRSGSHSTYMIEPSRERGPAVTRLTLILGGCIIAALLVAVALFTYLIKSRRRHRARRAAISRKRQTTSDIKNNNGINKEQFAALNKA